MVTMTAHDRRELDREAFDAYLSACPSRQLLDRISNKWVTLVICALGDEGTMRYSEISRRLAGVSQKMLTQTLRSLERDGLVMREVTPSVPVRVDYSLTALGDSLLETIQHVKRWAEQHMVGVEEARLRYDQRAAG
ncbi:winged helix-turn-helix transcriptional regulator [Ruania halotolerans]|uniref:winged helix-turn-helix transcriptional regulator n=1 Tax=Ruania halotolerans TaxID=2897773 RepID=UPI001E2973F2|nr:helix-turn-helix domain-containing protein [Ruania halotolerans]UFU06269.1 helix-turn-helix transcriptional regulator [Ruania halotolerans]